MMHPEHIQMVNTIKIEKKYSVVYNESIWLREGIGRNSTLTKWKQEKKGEGIVKGKEVNPFSDGTR